MLNSSVNHAESRVNATEGWHQESVTEDLVFLPGDGV